MSDGNKLILFDIHTIPFKDVQTTIKTNKSTPEECLKEFPFTCYYNNQPVPIFSFLNRVSITEYENIFRAETPSSRVLNDEEIKQFLIPSFR